MKEILLKILLAFILILMTLSGKKISHAQLSCHVQIVIWSDHLSYYI